MNHNYRSKAQMTATIALLIAMEVVLSRFLSIPTPIMKIGFSFVPIAICAMMYGPVWAGVCGAVADFIGAILFPIGPYFPGFTLSAALTGLIFGLFLYKRSGNRSQIALAVLLNCLGVSLILSTFWLTIITETSFLALLPTRALQNVIMIPLQFVVLYLLQKPMSVYVLSKRAS